MLNVIENGIVPDGKTLNTPGLQKLIDTTAESGGGTLLFPPGDYLTGGLVLRDKIHLHFEAGATLLGSISLDDYTLFDPPPVPFYEGVKGVRALLFAHGCRGVHLSGAGTINGQGPDIKRPPGVRASMPRNIWFAECEDVTVEGLRLLHSGFWMQHYLKCSQVKLKGIYVYNHGSCNNDGCDVDCCRDVIVSDCSIDSHDDALCLKSGNDTPTENVVVTNCVTRSHCNHFKTGTESNGGFRNVTVSNLQMVPSTVKKSDPKTGGADYRGACGIALGCVDGGMMENISVTHVQMDQTRVPFFIKFGDRSRTIDGTDQKFLIQFARNIRISNVTARGAGATGSYVMGLPEEPVRNVLIENCELEISGGGNDELAEAPVPIKRDAYPSSDAFGSLPAYGVYARDAEDVEFRNISFKLSRPDARPSIRWHRVKNIRLDGISEKM